jgi:DNA-binding CsgD family transcriptional regulator
MSMTTGAGLIGRAPELALVMEFLERIRAGTCGLVIEGDPGIGKSTLIVEAAAQADAREYRVLSSHPAPPDATLSFSGLEDLLRDVVEEIAPDLPDPQRRALETVLLLREPEGEPPGPFAVALAVRGALATAARERPLLVTIDDAQWLDEPTAAAIGHAVRRLGLAQVGLAIVWNPDSAPAGSPIAGSSLPSDPIRIAVGPLPPQDVRQLLLSRLDLSLASGQLDRLHRASGGNPMAALEIGRAIRDSGDRGEPGPVVPVPEDLADLVRRRLAELSPEGRQAILVVAAASEPTAALVEAVAGEPAREALAGAIREGLVSEAGGVLRVRHPLVGVVLYADAEPEARCEVHRRIAGSARHAPDRAMHLALSIEGTDEGVASEVEAAARASRARGAPAAAADLCEQAQRLTPPELSEELLRRGLLAADYSLEAGELLRSRTLLERILKSAPASLTRAKALERLGWIRAHQDSWASASDLFREAAVEAERDPALVAALHLDQGVAAMVAGDLPGAWSHAASALDLAGSLPDPGLRGACSALAASVDFLLGKGIDQDVLETAVAVENWSSPGPAAARPSIAFGVLLKWSDRLAESRALLEQGLSRAEEQGAEQSLPFILVHLSELECWLGDFPLAEQHARRAIEVADRTEQDAGRAFAMAALAMALAYLGREPECRAMATEGMTVASSTGAVPAAVLCESTLGFLELSLGRPDRAHQHLAPLVERAVGGGVHEPGAMRYLGDAIETLIAVGDVETADELIDNLDRRSFELDRAWGSMIAARARALVLAAGGDLAGARESVEAAVAIHDRLSEPFELARTLMVQGIIERRDRRKSTARDLLERALDLFSELGADLWVGRARDELARIGGRAPSSLSLTPTEDRIARRIADGATNMEVATSLYLAVKTVEWNLTRIYRKLGIHSRSELIRWMIPGSGTPS